MSPYMKEQLAFFSYLDHWDQVYWAIINEIVDIKRRNEIVDIKRRS